MIVRPDGKELKRNIGFLQGYHLVKRPDGKELKRNIGFLQGYHLVKQERMQTSAIASDRIWPDSDTIPDDCRKRPKK